MGTYVGLLFLYLPRADGKYTEDLSFFRGDIEFLVFDSCMPTGIRFRPSEIADKTLDFWFQDGVIGETAYNWPYKRLKIERDNYSASEVDFTCENPDAFVSLNLDRIEPFDVTETVVPDTNYQSAVVDSELPDEEAENMPFRMIMVDSDDPD